jgi:hypothetical protein
MENPIKLIYKFNREAGLLDQGYDDFLESSFQIEEALEGFNLRWLIRDLHDDDLMDDANAKQVSRSIIQSATEEVTNISDVDRLDKACDAVVFAVGSMAKLGLNPQEITKALNVVMHKNFEKLHCPKDEFGKLTKPVDFVGPEPELQLILDARSSK